MSDHFSILQQLMTEFWWVPQTVEVVDRPELCFSIDRGGSVNAVARINAPDEMLPQLVEEFSLAHQGLDSKINTYPSHSPLLFELLERAGYQPTHTQNSIIAPNKSKVVLMVL